ncbi:hypothetical protein HAX54_025169 [Datura stramonium]|uniref:Uncharacterized protein n=1 Tax=Datura stramonium TaxID=4076 RepID=A0ABS8V173_DATST|nr:hypothetical protein [Datura stramonium]
MYAQEGRSSKFDSIFVLMAQSDDEENEEELERAKMSLLTQFEKNSALHEELMKVKKDLNKSLSVMSSTINLIEELEAGELVKLQPVPGEGPDPPESHVIRQMNTEKEGSNDDETLDPETPISQPG